jgi:hypothetical protein
MAVALLVMAASFDAAATQELECSGAQKQWVVADLFFARNHVSEAGFARFLAAEVTPRFPGGFTVIDAKGQWRAPGSDRTSKERTKLLMIAMPPGADNGARLDQIVAAYKTRYRQQSVGLIIRPACVSF